MGDEDTTATAEQEPDTGGSLDEQLSGLDEEKVAEMASGGETPPPGEEPVDGEEPESAPSAEGDDPSEEPEGEPEPAPEHVRWEADGDPEGTYRDAEGRLRDADSHQFAEGEQVDPPEYIREVAEKEFSPEEAEDFFEGEGPAPDVDPIELEHDGEQMELAVEDQETREVLKEKLSAAEQVEEIESARSEIEQQRREVEATREELMGVEEGIKSDPSGYILDHLNPDPDTLSTLARDILAFNDDVFNEVAEAAQNWQMNPADRKEYRADRKEKLIGSREKRQRAVQQGVAVRKIGQRVTEEMIPADADQGTRQTMFDDIVREIEKHAEETGELPPVDEIEQIPGVQRRLELYGIDPETLSAESDGDAERANGDSSVAEAKPAGEPEEELMERAEKYRRTGVALRKKHERKQDAGSTSPAGAGASPSGLDLSDKNLDEAIEEAKQRMG